MEDQRIKETLRLARENNKLLKKLHKSAILSRVLRIFYWIIILGASVGAYYYIQPFIDQILEVYSGLSGALGL